MKFIKQFILLAATAALYLTNLSINGYANSYYTAAVQAASTSWKAFFFGSLDAGNFISVDKPPIAIWLMALSVRLFGFSSFTMLLPNALAGVITVWLTYLSVKRIFNTKSALISGIIMMLTPVAALMFRFNNPDAILTMFLTTSAYFFLKSLDSKKPLLNLTLTALFTGLAFNTKMLQGLVLLPIMVLIYLFFAKTPKFFTRLYHLLFAFLITTIACLWWPTIVYLTPASSRPYIGSSSNNSIWNLIIGYNGLNRLLGNNNKITGAGMGAPGGNSSRPSIPQNSNKRQTPPNFNQNDFGTPGKNMDGMGGPGGGMGPGGNGFGGQVGVFRMFNTDFGTNIAWLIPLALITFLVTFIKFIKLPRDNSKRSSVLFFFGWLILHIVVFSLTSGTIHPYYVVVLAPAIAALVGIGLPIIWDLYKNKKIFWLVLPLSICLTAIISYSLLSYKNYWPWLKYTVVICAIISAILLIIHHFKSIKLIKYLAITTAIFSLLAGPAFFTFSTINTAHSGSIPISGPGATAGHTNNELSQSDKNLINYLLTNRSNATWIVAVASANESAPIQISSGQPVMALGGFNGSDNAITLNEFKKLIANGQIKYYLISSKDNNSISTWVKENCTIVNYGNTNSGTLYQLKV